MKGLSRMYVTKHGSAGSIVALNSRADETRSPKRGGGLMVHKKTYVPQSKEKNNKASELGTDVWIHVFTEYYVSLAIVLTKNELEFLYKNSQDYCTDTGASACKKITLESNYLLVIFCVKVGKKIGILTVSTVSTKQGKKYHNSIVNDNFPGAEVSQISHFVTCVTF